MKICHVISSLEIGGAQKILAQLCERLPDEDLNFVVVSLTRETQLAARLRAAGCVVYCLNLRGICTLFPSFSQLRRILRREQPDVVQTWLYHADLFGSAIARSSGHKRIIWTVHHANSSFERDGWITRSIVKVLARLSRWVPEAIIYCSPVAQQVHEGLGYDKARGSVILNGVDEARFRPDASLRLRFRTDIGIADDVSVIGIVGRFAPIKGYDVFLEMAKQVKNKSKTSVAFVMAGTEVTPQNHDLVSVIRKHRLSDQCHLLGERTDVEALMNGIDLLVCPSYSESFGLVLVEAMACGTPAVASDLEATSIILAADRVAPVGDAAALAAKVMSCLDAPLSPSGTEALRESVTTRFGLATMIAKYKNLYVGAGYAQQSQ